MILVIFRWDCPRQVFSRSSCFPWNCRRHHSIPLEDNLLKTSYNGRAISSNVISLLQSRSMNIWNLKIHLKVLVCNPYELLQISVNIPFVKMKNYSFCAESHDEQSNKSNFSCLNLQVRLDSSQVNAKAAKKYIVHCIFLRSLVSSRKSRLQTNVVAATICILMRPGMTWRGVLSFHT